MVSFSNNLIAVQIEGTFNIDRVYPEWFGAKTTNDDTLAIQ